MVGGTVLLVPHFPQWPPLMTLITFFDGEREGGIPKLL